jgi:hypothetical protein
MKDQAFKVFRCGFRFLFSLPRRVRPLWRTLLAWGRLSRVFFRGGMEAVSRKNELKPSKPPFPNYPYRG